MTQKRRSLHSISLRVSLWIQNLNYLEKWIVLGPVIGVISSLIALLFLQLLTLTIGIAAWILGVVENPVDCNTTDFAIIAINARNRVLLPLLIVFGALISAAIVSLFEPDAEGPGVDAAIKAYHRGATTRLRLPLVKALASSLFLGFGGSGGVQGPGLQIGAGIGTIIARLLNLDTEDRRIAMIAGMAGLLSAIFRAPIGAALFAVEVLYRRDIETGALAPALIASMVSFAIAANIVGYQGVFPPIEVSVHDIYAPSSMAVYAVLCMVSSAVAWIYIKLFHSVKKVFRHLDKKWCSRLSLKPVIGAFIVAILGLFFPATLGSGVIYAIQLVVNSSENYETLDIELTQLLITLVMLKIVVTVFSVGSGGSGGLFAPSIFIGSLLGLVIGVTIGQYTSLPPSAFAYITMACFFGAATRTPIASSFMMAEMSKCYPLLIPALFTSLIASEILRNNSLYEAQPLRRVAIVHSQ